MNNNGKLAEHMQQRGASVKPLGFESQVRNWLTAANQQNLKKLSSLWGSQKEAKRFLVMALDCVSVNPELLKCSFDSFTLALLKCAQTRLYPGPGLNEAAIVPYKSEAKFIPMYQGLVKLGLQGGFIKGLWAEVVREHDEFDYEFGANRTLVHRPRRGTPKERGPRIACYACYKSIYGNVEWALMFAEEVEAIRKRAPGAGSAYSPWSGDDREQYGDVDWQWRKTILKQLLKLVPKSIELARAMQFDNEVEGAEPKEAAVHLDAEGVLGGLIDEPEATPPAPGDPKPS